MLASFTIKLLKLIGNDPSVQWLVCLIIRFCGKISFVIVLSVSYGIKNLCLSVVYSGKVLLGKFQCFMGCQSTLIRGFFLKKVWKIIQLIIILGHLKVVFIIIIMLMKLVFIIILMLVPMVIFLKVSFNINGCIHFIQAIYFIFELPTLKFIFLFSINIFLLIHFYIFYSR